MTTTVDHCYVYMYSCESNHFGVLSSFLQRAWVLGPKQSGPNLLLANTPERGSSLFRVAQDLVMHIDKKHITSRATRKVPAPSYVPKKAAGSDDDDDAMDDEDKSTISSVSIQVRLTRGY